MKKLDIRFCERNLREEQSEQLLHDLEERQRDLANLQIERCLGNCSICNQGPYCTVNDFLFQKDSAEELRGFMKDLMGKLRQGIAKNNNKS